MANGVKDYDVLVVGSGSGANVVDAALGRGLSVGWVDKGPLGGTCLNVGCIPSKMLIVPADRIVEIQEAARLGIEAHIDSVNFASIMEYMRQDIAETQGHIRSGLAEAENLDFYEAEGHFVDDYTLQVGDRRIRGEKVYLAAGTRVFIPPIEGIDQVDYLTNESVLALTERPESPVSYTHLTLPTILLV